MDLQPHQVAAIERLRDALSETDQYEDTPRDDSMITVDDDNTFTQLIDEGGSPLTLGHLRDICSIFSE